MPSQCSLPRLSRLKFDKGVAGYLEVLIAENEFFAAAPSPQ
jgi:outer membrane protein TolC